MIELTVGKQYRMKVSPEQTIMVEIKRLDVPKREAEFMVTGAGVVNPEQPRVMSIVALARWLSIREVQ